MAEATAICQLAATALKQHDLHPYYHRIGLPGIQVCAPHTSAHPVQCCWSDAHCQLSHSHYLLAHMNHALCRVWRQHSLSCRNAMASATRAACSWQQSISCWRRSLLCVLSSSNSSIVLVSDAVSSAFLLALGILGMPVDHSLWMTGKHAFRPLSPHQPLQQAPLAHHAC